MRKKFKRENQTWDKQDDSLEWHNEIANRHKTLLNCKRIKKWLRLTGQHPTGDKAVILELIEERSQSRARSAQYFQTKLIQLPAKGSLWDQIPTIKEWQILVRLGFKINKVGDHLPTLGYQWLTVSNNQRNPKILRALTFKSQKSISNKSFNSFKKTPIFKIMATLTANQFRTRRIKVY